VEEVAQPRVVLLHVVRRGFVGPRGLGWLVTSITTSAAVEVALLPVMAETFSRVTAAGVGATARAE
jgi:hypothetical protein